MHEKLDSCLCYAILRECRNDRGQEKHNNHTLKGVVEKEIQDPCFRRNDRGLRRGGINHNKHIGQIK